MPDDVVSSIIHLISSRTALHGYAATQLYKVAANVYMNAQPLTQVITALFILFQRVKKLFSVFVFFLPSSYYICSPKRQDAEAGNLHQIGQPYKMIMPNVKFTFRHF